MEKQLNKLINQRLASIEADILAGNFSSEEVLQKEIDRLINLMITKAVFELGVKESSDEIREYLNQNFTIAVIEFYQKHKISSPANLEKPENYYFESKVKEIEKLIRKGKVEQAETILMDCLAIVNNDKMLDHAISNGLFTQEDVDYFCNVSYPYLIEFQKSPGNQKIGLASRIGLGISFILTGQNPYDGKKVNVKKEKVSKKEKKSLKEKIAENKILGWVKKHPKITLTSAGLAVLAGVGISIGTSRLHKKSVEFDDSFSYSVSDAVTAGMGIERKTISFEVDEFHNFNINDQETHTEKLQELAKEVMERGWPVVSEEEAMRMNAKEEFATSPEQLNNFLISLNLEDMTNLTFTKLLEGSNTDQEELSSDFSRVCEILGMIYTTKVEEPFVYKFISNKEYSEFVKIYEEAMIQNQKGNSEDLIQLFNDRIDNPVQATSGGPVGFLIDNMICQQENVYNANVLGKTKVDLYNYKIDCNKDATYYSTDYQGFRDKLSEKIDAALVYAGSEAKAYQSYLSSLSDNQKGNKQVIEATVLPYLELHGIKLGSFDVIFEIANDTHIYGSSAQATTQTNYSTPSKSETKVVPKKPETPEEKEVVEQTEAELDEHNRSIFKDTVDAYAKKHNGTVTKLENGDFKISIKGKKPIIVNSETMGAYDKDNDYDGEIYEDYKEFMKDNKDNVENVDGVGEVVVEGEGSLKLDNNNVSKGPGGTIIDNTTGKEIFGGLEMTEDEIDQYLKDHPELEEYLPVDYGDITYSEVDDKPPVSTDSNTVDKENDKVSGTDENTNTGNDSIPDYVDQGTLDQMTEEERQEFLDMIANGEEPIVDETFEDTIYGYSISDLVNNPGLCQNIPASVLQDYPEIMELYQSWLQQQASFQSDEFSVESSYDVETQALQEDEFLVEATNYSAEIQALQEEKESLLAGNQPEISERVL